jgi:hypothetical protein
MRVVMWDQRTIVQPVLRDQVPMDIPCCEEQSALVCSQLQTNT